jgi:hypothetical protein
VERQGITDEHPQVLLLEGGGRENLKRKAETSLINGRKKRKEQQHQLRQLEQY